MRIVILTSWGGSFPIPILKYLINNNNFNIIRIYSQPIHWKKLSNNSFNNLENYEDNVENMISKESYKNHFKIQSVNTPDVVNFILKNNIDYVFSVSYGEILKKEFIKSPKYGVINFHPGLLPENQGPDPINASLFYNHDEVGVSIHFIDEGIDSGDILVKKGIKFSENDNFQSLQLKLGFLSVNLLENIFDKLKNKSINVKKQNLIKKKYYKKLSTIDYRIDFSMSSEEIHKIYRCASGLFNKSFFVYKNHKIFFEKCQILDFIKGYNSHYIIDYGLNYLVIATKNSGILLTSIRVDFLNTYDSEKTANKLFKNLKNV